MIGVTAQRVLERRVQPPARERQAIAVGHRAERGIAGEVTHLLPHPLQQRDEIDRRGLHIELKRLARAKL